MFDPFVLSEAEALALNEAPGTDYRERTALLMHPSSTVRASVAKKLFVSKETINLMSEYYVDHVAHLSLFEPSFMQILLYLYWQDELIVEAARNRLASDAMRLLESPTKERMLALMSLRAMPKHFWDRWSVSPMRILESLGRGQQRLVLAAWTADQELTVWEFVYDCLVGLRRLGRPTRHNAAWEPFRPTGSPDRINNWYVLANFHQFPFSRPAWEGLVQEIMTGAPVDSVLQSDDAFTLFTER
jgi:hypothetical protein